MEMIKQIASAFGVDPEGLELITKENVVEDIDKLAIRVAEESGVFSPGNSYPTIRDALVAYAKALLAEVQRQNEPVAKVLFRQDDDGLDPVTFYGPGSEPDPSKLKDRFTLRDVWISPPSIEAEREKVAEATWKAMTEGYTYEEVIRGGEWRRFVK